MLQLIIGISLGVILLFVVMLLITELASTYPVWKHFQEKNSPPFGNPLPVQKEKQTGFLRLSLLVLAAVLGIIVVVLLVINSLPATGTANAKSAATKSPVKETPATRKLTDLSTEYGLLFTLQTKWEDGKIYGNNRVLFQKAPVTVFSDWLYSLLDRDGFLIKEFHFSPNDFVFETAADGSTTALLNRFNAPMSLREYQRISRLQVVIDKRVPALAK